MHTAQESKLGAAKVGIIAGSGRMPALLAEKLEASGITPYILALEGIADPETYQGRTHAIIPIGMAGGILAWFRQNGVTDIVMTGALKRPEWTKLKVDPRGMKIIAKVALKALGDDGLLRAIRREIEADGFKMRGIQEFVPELLAPSGLMTKSAPLPEDDETIRLGWNAAKEHGRQDKGQSVIVQQDTVLGREGNEGTSSLMKKAAAIKSTGRGPILVKVCKPQQDKALDMPTIGTQTVQIAHEHGYAGIVVEAGETLIMNREEVIALCDQYGLFLLGKSNDA